MLSSAPEKTVLKAIVMSPAAAWTLLVLGFVLPLLHVAFSPKGGPWKAPERSSCPFSPKMGWLVIVLFLGPVGWLMFMGKTKASGKPPLPSERPRP